MSSIVDVSRTFYSSIDNIVNIVVLVYVSVWYGDREEANDCIPDIDEPLSFDWICVEEKQIYRGCENCGTSQRWSCIVWKQLKKPLERAKDGCVTLVPENLSVLSTEYPLAYTLINVMNVCCLHRWRLNCCTVYKKGFGNWSKNEAFSSV